MSVAEIEEAIGLYADAAFRAKRAGFDMVELHGGKIWAESEGPGKGRNEPSIPKHPLYHEWCFQWVGGTRQEAVESRRHWFWSGDPLKRRTGGVP
jgi:hypothetical protein